MAAPSPLWRLFPSVYHSLFQPLSANAACWARLTGLHSLAIGTVFLPATFWTEGTWSSLGQMTNFTFRCHFPSSPRSYFPPHAQLSQGQAVPSVLTSYKTGRNKAGGRKARGPRRQTAGNQQSTRGRAFVGSLTQTASHGSKGQNYLDVAV